MHNIIKLSAPATSEFWEIEVLFEDTDLLALNKPAGLLSSPDRYDPTRPNLMTLLHAGITEGKPWAVKRGLTYLMNAHRPDSESSGIILLAKSKPVLVKLANLFGSDQPVKRYAALVHGDPAEDRFTVGARLSSHPTQPGLVRVDPKNGKRSRTVFEVRERFRGWALLSCQPVTERRHQIPVHLKSLGLPVVADSLYGGRPLLLSRLKQQYRLKPKQIERPLIGRLALHAEELSLLHPVTGAPITITAPWPKDLQVGIKYLRRYAMP